MKLCFKCFVELGNDPKEWDRVLCDSILKEKCVKCGMFGFYVRDIRDVLPEKEEEDE